MAGVGPAVTKVTVAGRVASTWFETLVGRTRVEVAVGPGIEANECNELTVLVPAPPEEFPENLPVTIEVTFGQRPDEVLLGVEFIEPKPDVCGLLRPQDGDILVFEAEHLSEVQAHRIETMVKKLRAKTGKNLSAICLSGGVRLARIAREEPKET